MTIPDPIGDIVKLLRADDAVAELASTRVFSGGLPEKQSGMPQACVVVKPAGGPGRRGYNRYRRNRIDTICYGADLHESWLLHCAVREVLELLRRPGAVFWAETVSEGTNALHPTTQWPVCYASYTVQSATES